MRPTKVNLVRFLTLLMAFGMLFGLSMLFAASPLVILMVLCASVTMCVCLMRIAAASAARKAKGRAFCADGVTVSDQTDESGCPLGAVHRTELLVMKTPNLFAFNANDQNVFA